MSSEDAGKTRMLVPKGFLTVKRGPGRGSVFVVSRSTTLLGRQPDCDVVIADPSLSRHHAEVRQEGEGFVVEDLGSTNGTQVNGSRIDRPQPIKDGDELQVGEVTLTFNRLLPRTAA